MGKHPWDVELMEAIGKAMPNEITKLNSWLQYIPYVGVVSRAMSGLDSAATSYNDLYDYNREQGMSSGDARKNSIYPAISEGMNSFSGASNNPGKYGSGGNVDRDWADYVGGAGNVFRMSKYGNSSGKNNFQGMFGGVTSMFGDQKMPGTWKDQLAGQTGINLNQMGGQQQSIGQGQSADPSTILGNNIQGQNPYYAGDMTMPSYTRNAFMAFNDDGGTTFGNTPEMSVPTAVRAPVKTPDLSTNMFAKLNEVTPPYQPPVQFDSYLNTMSAMNMPTGSSPNMMMLNGMGRF